MEYTTADGFTVGIGSRVFNYYDREWGHIKRHDYFPDWFEFEADSGRVRSLNGERVSVKEWGQ